MARKPFEQLNFADDGMFQAVMKNPEASAELVERLLGVRVKSVKYPKLEKKIAPFFDEGRGLFRTKGQLHFVHLQVRPVPRRKERAARALPLHFSQCLHGRFIGEFG